MDTYPATERVGVQTGGQKNTRLLRQLSARCVALQLAFEIVFPDGAKHLVGSGCPEFRIVLHNSRAMRAFASLNEIQVAKSYFNGDFDFEGDMLRALGIRQLLDDPVLVLRIWRFLQPLLLGQTRLNKQAIASHYDSDPQLFSMFLDPEMPIYTHGVYESDDETLATAGERKFEYCFSRLRLKRGDHVLEVGPGWGAWLRYASDRGIACTGISISRSSLEYLSGLAEQGGYHWDLVFSDLLEFEPKTQFDAVVMMGVIEHLPEYQKVLTKLASLVKPGGRIYLDGGSCRTNEELSSVIANYIYPGNHALLDLPRFMQAMSKTELHLLEAINDRHSYYLTFVQWARNLERSRHEITQKFGEALYRKFLIFFWGFAYAMNTRAVDCYRMIIEKPEN